MKKTALALLLALSFICHAGESSYDVAVYGGTPGGFAAAIAAARNGSSVVLIEQTGHIGGLNTSGINTAETEHMLVWTIGGISLEFYERLGKNIGKKGPAFYFLSSSAEKTFNEMLDEAKIEKRFKLRATKVDKTGARIQRITLSDGSIINAKMFIDATYEGDLMARAGVSYTFGRESRDQYGEELAGIRLDKTTRKANPYDENGKLLPGIR
jgi:flavin-dependent dehydrogenase